MTRHHSIDELRARMSSARRARNVDVTQAMLRDMAVHELRQARDKSEEELARALARRDRGGRPP